MVKPLNNIEEQIILNILANLVVEVEIEEDNDAYDRMKDLED